MSSRPATSSNLPVTSAAHGGNNRVVDTKRYTKRAQALDCCKLIFFLGVIVTSLGLVPGVTRLLIFLQPKTPEFWIQASSFSFVNASQGSVTADVDVTVLVDNTNRKDVFFDDIKSFLAVTDERVSNVSIAPVRAPRNSRPSLKGEFRGVEMDVGNCSFGVCGEFNLTVEVEAEAEYEGFAWPARKDKIRVLCEGFRVSRNLTAGTTMNLGSSGCAVNGRWKRLETKCENIFWNSVYVATIFVAILLLSL